jgi:hypothetical protein
MFIHGTTYSYKLCKCDICKKAERLYRNELRKKRLKEMSPDDPRHGKTRLYDVGCRCELCSKEKLDIQRAYRLRKRNTALAQAKLNQKKWMYNES